jgi:hypothetical protein
MNLKTYSWVALALLVLDWSWGMAQVRGLVPLWSFLLLNFPFAWPYVWIESHWAGTHYSVGGRTVSEFWSLGLFCFMVLSQAGLYHFLLKDMRWSRRWRGRV